MEKIRGLGGQEITFGSEKFEMTLRHRWGNVKEETEYMRVKETDLDQG